MFTFIIRDARMEARIARREDKRGREGTPDTAHLPGGGDASGFGGDDSFAAAKQRSACTSLTPCCCL